MTGAILLEWLRPTLRGPGRATDNLRRRLESRGLWGAAPLGALCALSFRPASAALFFGSLVPLALKFHSPVLHPAVYGAGTALPVVGFAFVIAFGARFVGEAFNRLAQVESWARRLTGFVFIAVGFYMTMAHTFGVFG